MSSLNTEICGRCGKRVYHAEARVGAGRQWHKVGCFTCKVCNISLRSTNFCENNEEGEIYCTKCYGTNYGPKGYGYGVGAGTLGMEGSDRDFVKSTGPLTCMVPIYTGGNRCKRCGGSVYHAEEMLGAGLSWHKHCFRCKDCGKKLDSTTLKENEKEIYCNACYGKHFGPKGYGFGGGSGALKATQ